MRSTAQTDLEEILLKVFIRSGPYLVFEAKVEMGQHVQTWWQQGQLDGYDAQLPFLGLAWVTTDTDDITTAQFVVYGHKLLLRLVVPESKKRYKKIKSLNWKVSTTGSKEKHWRCNNNLWLWRHSLSVKISKNILTVLSLL